MSPVETMLWFTLRLTKLQIPQSIVDLNIKAIIYPNVDMNNDQNGIYVLLWQTYNCK